MLETTTTAEMIEELQKRSIATVIILERQGPTGNVDNLIEFYYSGGLSAASGMCIRFQNWVTRKDADTKDEDVD